ncbi:MAG: MFS transporter [Betaproteobacteria bacterium]|nr:MFS transporter [Betaproteobacteria bacterium]
MPRPEPRTGAGRPRGWAAVRPEELRALLWSFAYFFCLLASYYILRPLRDEMGVAGGVRNLHWLFTATFVAMLVAVPVFGAVVARLPRRRFIPLVYHFFVLNIAVFWVLLALGIDKETTARVFFVWISVFNLFAVSVFWSFMADLFSAEQGKRLFAYIAAGGSAGALAGPALTVLLVKLLGTANMLVLAAILLEAAVLCALRIERTQRDETAKQQAVGGNPFAGFALLARSPYLAGIAFWVVLLSLAGTFLYFEQANVVAAASSDPAERTRIFASIDLAAGILTLVVQLAATGRFMARFGAGPAAALLPAVFLLGFALLAAGPTIALVVGFQALQRTVNFAVSNPARETLFTVVGREEKYKAKYIIDGVVFRGADAASASLFNALRGAGWELSALSLAVLPLAAAWMALSLALGRAQERRS